jgi:hypothetical protein
MSIGKKIRGRVTARVRLVGLLRRMLVQVSNYHHGGPLPRLSPLLTMTHAQAKFQLADETVSMNLAKHIALSGIDDKDGWTFVHKSSPASVFDRGSPDAIVMIAVSLGNHCQNDNRSSHTGRVDHLLRLWT